MKTLTCGDVIPGCSARFAAPTEDVLFTQVVDHVTEDHGVAEVAPELVAAVRAQIR